MTIVDAIDEKRCCSCTHNIRKQEGKDIYCECEIDKHHIGYYVELFTCVCEEYKAEGKGT